MITKTLESVYDASARLNIPVKEILGSKSFSQLVSQGEENGCSLFSEKQMNWIAQNLNKSNRLILTLEQKAQIIELFMCEKNNQLTRISKITDISYHRVFKVIESHMNDLWNHKNDDSNFDFVTLESKIN